MKIGPLSDPRIMLLQKLEGHVNEIIESKRRVIEIFADSKNGSDIETALLASISLTVDQLLALTFEIRRTMHASFDITVDASLRHRKRSVASGGGTKRAEKYKSPEMLEAKRQIIQIYRDAKCPRGKDKFVEKEIDNMRARCRVPELKISTARGWLKGIS